MQRGVIGRLWLELVVKHYVACRDADATRQTKLFDLIDSLTDEYPDTIKAEIVTYTRDQEEAAPAPPNGAANEVRRLPSGTKVQVG